MKIFGRARGAAVGMLLAGGLASGCSTNPATGQRQLSLISESQEIEMGKQSDPEIVASMGTYADEALQQYVSQLGQRLAAASERPDLPWTFRVIDDPTVNAFAVPGGFIYVTRGLLSHITSEAQLAGVIGHEIGHVTARHSVNDLSKQQIAQLGLGIGMIFSPTLASLGELAGAGLQVLFLKYSRDHENQADELGVRYMRRLSYEPTQLAEVMQMLERSSEIEGGSGKVPEWLSTHPNPPNRVAHILQLARASGTEPPGSGAPVVRREEFVRRLDGMVFGDNPREGFFEGSTFLHPDMRFRFDFPTGWKGANGKTAVQATSPNQDALMGITAADGSPSQALAEFASGQNVQVVDERQISLGGERAVEAEFGAATEQGALHGLVAFVSHNGMTLQIMGYTPESRWGSYATTFSRSIASFGTLTDQRALSVQPNRVDVVQLPSSMTFASFTQRFPSTAKPEIVAVINQVEGDVRLSSGALYKRIVAGR